jgi:hypothetical protein
VKSSAGLRPRHKARNINARLYQSAPWCNALPRSYRRTGITDVNGHAVEVVHRRLPEDSATDAVSRPSGPRNGRELAHKLEHIARKLPAGEPRDELMGLARWAMQAES